MESRFRRLHLLARVLNMWVTLHHADKDCQKAGGKRDALRFLQDGCTHSSWEGN